MPRVETHLDAETEAAFRAFAKRESMTRSAVLRHVIVTLLRRRPAPQDDAELAEGRTKRLYVNVTPELYKAVGFAANQAGMTRPGAVLAVLRARFFSAPTVLKSEAEGLARAAFELGKVGANLNQLVRLLHQHRQELPPIPDAVLTETLRVVSDLRKQINDLVESATTRWQGRQEKGE